MANQPPAVVTKFALPDPNAAPLNLTQLFQLANLLVSSEIQGPYLNIIVQTGDPGADDATNKVWLQLDSQRRPIALKTFYNGHWRRVYNGMLGEIRGYTGNPSIDFTLPEGLGKIGETYDGWHICNGKSGTPDFSNRFLVGANMNPAAGKPSGYDHGWQTLITPGDIVAKSGGQWTEVLTPENIPFPAKERTAGVDHWTADGNARATDGPLFGRHDASSDEYLVDAEKGNANPVGVFTGPPFFALAWIVFVGYAS